jgi:hypothetical protein
MKAKMISWVHLCHNLLRTYRTEKCFEQILKCMKYKFHVTYKFWTSLIVLR